MKLIHDQTEKHPWTKITSSERRPSAAVHPYIVGAFPSSMYFVLDYLICFFAPKMNDQIRKCASCTSAKRTAKDPPPSY